jgi:hypothetical protein
VHKSRLAGFIIDCETDDLHEAGRFWSAALGMESGILPGTEGEKYLRLRDLDRDLHIEVQKVSHPSRVHLDIETDDVEAEVQRLESLGATRVQRGNRWWVMQAPSGQRFCVVPASTSGFETGATDWP